MFYKKWRAWNGVAQEIARMFRKKRNKKLIQPLIWMIEMKESFFIPPGFVVPNAKKIVTKPFDGTNLILRNSYMPKKSFTEKLWDKKLSAEE